MFGSTKKPFPPNLLITLRQMSLFQGKIVHEQSRLLTILMSKRAHSIIRAFLEQDKIFVIHQHEWLATITGHRRWSRSPLTTLGWCP